MEKDGIHHVDFKNMYEDNIFRFNDEDFFMMDDIKELPDSFYNMETDYVVNIYCNEGRFLITVDDKEYEVKEDGCIFCLPGSILHDYMMSPDVNITVFGFSIAALERSSYINRYIWQFYDYIRKHPVVYLSEMDMKIIDSYYYLSLLKVQQAEDPFTKSIASLLFQSFAFEFLNIVAKEMKQDKKIAENSAVRQKDTVLHQFLDLLADSDGKIRSVAVASNKLHLTPKYFSHLIKQSSGKTPLQWIHEYTKEAIIRHLIYSPKTIKEIASEMNFPSIAFFGKFVKSQLGVSPTEYRNTHKIKYK